MCHGRATLWDTSKRAQPAHSAPRNGRRFHIKFRGMWYRLFLHPTAQQEETSSHMVFLLRSAKLCWETPWQFTISGFEVRLLRGS
jgi:hypothetical protein